MAVPLFNIGGLASGLDTSAIIESVLAVERLPISQLQSRRTDHQIEDNAWQAINTRYSAIRTALDSLDSRNELNKFALATSSNTSAVTVTTTGAATPGSVSFTVDQLAANHQVASASSFVGSGDLVGAGDFTVTIDGVDTTITTTSDTTLAQLAAKINGLDIGISASAISVDGTSYKLLMSADATGASNTFTTSGSVPSANTMDVIQQGQDAQITIGSGGSGLTLSRSTNTVSDLLPGVSIELTATTTAAVTVSAKRDVGAATEAIAALVGEINSTLSTIADATRYSPDADSGGPLIGNSTARSLAMDLKSSISSFVNSGSADYPVASAIGISLNRQGTFDVDTSKLKSALENDFDGVVELLVASGSASDSRVSFAAAGSSTLDGDYEVVVTQAATKASALSDAYTRSNSDITFQIVSGTTTVDVNILKHDPIEAVVQAIEDALDAAGLASINVSQINQGGDDYIQLAHSAYGFAAGFEVIGDPFGMAGTYVGSDVAGTIGGEAATGSGQSLTASAGSPLGLVVKVTATAAEISGAGGNLALGNLSYTHGVLGSLDKTIGYAEGSGGRIARAKDLAAAQMDLIDDRIEVLEDRLDRREALLIRQYAALETAMSSMQTQSQWLSQQVASMNAGSK